jgi:DNA-binding transcriptional ArsR family regulator
MLWLVIMHGKPSRTVRQDAPLGAYDAVLDALGDPTRRAILERLRDGPKPVVEIAEGLPVGRPAVSQHLKVLKEAGLVTDRAVGTRRIYGVDADGMASVREYAQSFWSAALTRHPPAAERASATKAGKARGTEDADGSPSASHPTASSSRGRSGLDRPDRGV